MRLNTAVNTLDTNAKAVSTNFGIGDVGMVIEILRSKLYSHPIRTLVQEYLCNGRDAMREVKTDKRLIVTAPTTFNPEFKVRDFGPGISPDRIENVFVLYGASTKRKDNTQTGGFGIGAKSAWSYTDSFTVTTFIDGVKREYVAHIGTSQNGSLDFVSESPTDEANGTEIKLAVKSQDIPRFTKAILRASYFWNDNEQPVIKGMIQPDYTALRRNDINIAELTITDTELDFMDSSSNNYYSQRGFFIVVDGVPYQINEDFVSENKDLESFRNKMTRNVSVFCKVQTGFVEVSANREQLSDSKLTRDALNLVAGRWVKLLDQYHADKFKDCVTVMDYLKAHSLFEKVFIRSTFTNEVDGYKISDSTVTSDSLKKTQCVIVQKISNDNLKYDNKTKVFFHIDELKTLYVNDLPSDSNKVDKAAYLRAATGTAKRGAVLIISNGAHNSKKKADGTYEMVYEKLSDAEFDKLVTDLEITRLSSVTPEYKVKATRSGKSGDVRQKGEITVWTPHKENLNLDNIQKQYVYVGLEDKELQWQYRGLVEHKGYKLVRISEAGIKKIKDDKDFQTLDTFIAAIANDADLKSALITQWLMDSNVAIERLKKFEKHITNPLFKKMIALYNNECSVMRSNLSTKVKELAGAFDGMEQTKKEIAEFKQLVDTKFNIIEELHSWNEDKNENIFWYINNRT